MTTEIKKGKIDLKKQLTELAAKVVESEKGVKIGNVIKIGAKLAVIESITAKGISLKKITIHVKYLTLNGFKGYTWIDYKYLKNGVIFSDEDSWRKSMQEKTSLQKA